MRVSFSSTLNCKFTLVLYKVKELLSPIENSFSLVDGNFTIWTNWSNCSRTCGVGEQERTRSCTNPAQRGEGKPCSGNESETKSCNITLTCPGKTPFLMRSKIYWNSVYKYIEEWNCKFRWIFFTFIIDFYIYVHTCIFTRQLQKKYYI